MSSVSVKPLVWFACGLAVVTLAGCSSENTKTAQAQNSGKYVVQLAHARNAKASFSKAPVLESNNVTLVDRVVWNAQKQQGKMYRFGGESPQTGFDCSGLTQFAFGQGAGVSLPRTAAAQYDAAVKVPRASATKGDLVFFNTRGRKVGHVGIYLGDNKFVHAPRTGKAITTEKLEGYWGQRIVGFGRIPGACRPAMS
ncbi:MULTISPECIES: C40 family peptidase [Thiothrix]|jgi:cell wall-associated NlpC family hydrolase|uniref:C40 family peptidase n=1 Tax=Thiothrix unzii TaxID=111769 RepID=A0A975FA47_9GAMM|nr:MULTISPECIES: C40 family peptidase [Thiothrix]MDX9989854.1 C40 family peptidase [Thiothrix unzii]QTR53803.1 C40 family peptidase [Thiothrix unzii]